MLLIDEFEMFARKVQSRRFNDRKECEVFITQKTDKEAATKPTLSSSQSYHKGNEKLESNSKVKNARMQQTPQ